MTKICMDNYVWDIYLYVKFHHDYPFLPLSKYEKMRIKWLG